MSSARRAGAGMILGATLVALAGIATILLFGLNLAGTLPAAGWSAALLHPDPGNLPQLVVHDSLLPRLAVGLLCGAGLGLAGALFQQVLDNPLAEPGTLGVFAGAKLALALATLWLPELLAFGYEPVALTGGAACLGLVLLLSNRQGFAPLAVILAGLIVALYFEAIAKMLVLAHFEALADLFQWQAGWLNQNSWSVAASLAPRIGLAALAAALLARPLALLDLDEAGARSLGLPIAWIRLAALLVAVFLGASIAGAVGAIGFIGLAGPAIARLGGARRLRDRMLWGSLVGAVLLALADQLVQALFGRIGLPTGTVTALLGAPLLVVLLVRLRKPDTETRLAVAPSAARRRRSWPLVAALVPTLLLLVLVALALGRLPGGWVWTWSDLGPLLPWRAPRVFAALGAGVMLGGAGTLLQRLTGNPIASPELLGISSGAALALVAAVFAGSDPGRAGLLACAIVGAGLVLAAVLALGRRSGYAPAHMLLVGVALTYLLGSVVALILASADPRTAILLTWLSGSTYNAGDGEAAFACVLAAVTLLAAPLLARWLEILPLGASAARAVGVAVPRARLGLLAATAVLTGASTLIVGPLSFVGLMAPHIARMVGLQRPTPQFVAAGLLGGTIMVGADWLGRMIAFPWQVPAGLVATGLGGTYFIWLMLRR
ncbi:MAG: Fe(3+)-hydroxamate ABC transporter permease FhuB [Methylorubrum populi]